MKYEEFTPMHQIHKEDVEGERFKIERLHLSEEVVEREKRTAWRTAGGYNEVRGLEAGTYVKLVDKNKREIVMSDTWMEQATNIDFVRKANGHVLIGGLGIGMVVLAIQDKPEVESVTVVELHQEVYDLTMKQLKPHLNDKVKVVVQDIHDFIPDRKYDVIYCDIWNNITSDNWEEMKDLTKKFKYKVNRENKNHMLDHWRKNDVHRLYKKEQNERYFW